MAGVTIPYGFELPVGGEKISVPLLNRNSGKMNDELKKANDLITALTTSVGKIEIKVSKPTTKNAAWDITGTEVIRVRKDTVGLIIYILKVKSINQFTMPAVIGSSLGTTLPAGYRLKASSLWQVAIASGAGINQSSQLNVDSDGTLNIRNNGANGSTTAGSTLGAIIVGEWDGSLT